MNTRIRYVKDPDGSLVSMQVFTDRDGHDLKLRISADGKEGHVTFATTGDSLVRVTGSSSHKTKIAIKKAIKQLGISFDKEKRNKTKGDLSEVSIDPTND